jgi:hypothetical protein
MQTKKSAWLPVKKAYDFAEIKGLVQYSNVIEEFVKGKNFQTKNNRDYRRALYMKLFQKHGIWLDFVQIYWQDANIPIGIKSCKKYEKRLNELKKYPQILSLFNS